MPMDLTRNEVAAVMKGEAIGVTRYYGGQCERQPGDEILLTFGTGNDVVAKATVVSVRPFRYRDRAENTAEAREEARKEGWASPMEWAEHMRRLYGELPEGAMVHRIQFRVDVRADQVPDNAAKHPMLEKRS
jgi:hypothetical protein